MLTLMFERIGDITFWIIIGSFFTPTPIILMVIKFFRKRHPALLPRGHEEIFYGKYEDWNLDLMAGPDKEYEHLKEYMCSRQKEKYFPSTGTALGISASGDVKNCIVYTMCDTTKPYPFEKISE